MIKIEKAKPEDMKTILKIQYAAYQSEALLHNDFTIQPLTQTLEESIEEYHKSVVLKAVQAGEIIGSVRARAEGGTVYIGKMMVHPDHQGNGLGKRLLSATENEFPGKHFELYTAAKSFRNLHFYKTAGYTPLREVTDNSGIVFVFLGKG
ncbi:MAG: GNAT family N-acetyltransferase [Treponema sp.]|nr:GNAT family N-acetyltransferase [Treponema sp.]